MGVGGNQLHALQATAHQSLQEPGPERLGLGWADLEADDLAPAVGVDRHGDYRRNRDDPAARSLLEVSGIEPEIGPFSLQRPLQEGQDPLVDLLAEFGHLALGDAGQAHHPPGGG